jgi:hypothetical protein
MTNPSHNINEPYTKIPITPQQPTMQPNVSRDTGKAHAAKEGAPPGNFPVVPGAPVQQKGPPHEQKPSAMPVTVPIEIARDLFNRIKKGDMNEIVNAISKLLKQEIC